MTKGDIKEIADSGDSGGILFKSNTEAPGEEVVRAASFSGFIASFTPKRRLWFANCFLLLCSQDASLITVPNIVDPVTKGSVKNQVASSGWPVNTMGVQSQVDNTFYESNMVTTDEQEFYSGRYDSQYGQGGGYLVSSGANLDNQYLAQNSGFLHNWQTNGRYLQQVRCFTPCDCHGGSKGTSAAPVPQV